MYSRKNFIPQDFFLHVLVLCGGGGGWLPTSHQHISWDNSAERAPPLNFSKNFDFRESLGLLLWHQAVCQNVALECLYLGKVNKSS